MCRYNHNIIISNYIIDGYIRFWVDRHVDNFIHQLILNSSITHPLHKYISLKPQYAIIKIEIKIETFLSQQTCDTIHKTLMKYL